MSALESEPHDPVILMTGMPDDGLRRRAAEAGAVGILVKPFRLETLVAAVKAAVATGEGQAQGAGGE